ncbi:phosphate ABC transporter permease PstA [Agilicoccus flavus]|uniref:phosphate ABC transporter permease PstA n=1 Tax=Agilicoccus flavus TaxID=2775968 RepID=UPI001CF66ADA|nr:phosphate ABC transporter permease PstA [Agilicoccus flavus]
MSASTPKQGRPDAAAEDVRTLEATPSCSATRVVERDAEPAGPAGNPRNEGASGHKSGGRAAADVAARIIMWGAFVLAVIPLVWILWSVVSNGLELVGSPRWWSDDAAGTSARRPGGGALHAIVGTLEMAAVTALIAVPIGVLTAVYLVEYGRGRLARLVSFMVDILTGVPSIVAGLFIYAFWVTTLGGQRIPFAATLSLVLLMIPVVVRSTEEMLKLVPNELREASFALGVPKWKTIVQVVLPTAFSGIVTGILLGLARVMGETAPLIILAPYTKYLQGDLFANLMATLPTMINDNRTEVTQAAIDRAWAASLTLILIILAFNLVGRLIARTSKVKA